MNKNTIICEDCRHARKSHGKIMDCTTIGSIELAALYGRCRRFQPIDRERNNGNTMFPNLKS